MCVSFPLKPSSYSSMFFTQTFWYYIAPPAGPLMLVNKEMKSWWIGRNNKRTFFVRTFFFIFHRNTKKKIPCIFLFRFWMTLLSPLLYCSSCMHKPINLSWFHCCRADDPVCELGKGPETCLPPRASREIGRKGSDTEGHSPYSGRRCGHRSSDSTRKPVNDQRSKSLAGPTKTSSGIAYGLSGIWDRLEDWKK